MILEFELALATNYIKYLVPQIQDIKFSNEEDFFYWDDKITKYPSALIFRESSEPDFCARYQVTDDVTLKHHTLFPYIQPYTLRVFVEKQHEAVQVRDSIRIKHSRNPYNHFTYRNSPFKIGLRLLNLSIESVRSNRDKKGAQRVVEALFQTTLVLTDSVDIPTIEQVNLKISEGTKRPNIFQRIFKRDYL